MASPPIRVIPCRLHPAHLADTVESLLDPLVRCVGSRRAVLCTERRLARLLAPQIERLGDALGGAPVVTFEGGERRKTRRTKERVEDALLELGAGRDSILVAVGGGVVTDLAGFAAATYMRGIPYVSLPTTLLGMVDAALGGKTGVDTPRGKNLVGAFHPPEGVFAALEFLHTLPRRQFRSGLAECLKHGLYMDAAYFEWLRGRAPRDLRRDREALASLVHRSMTLKCAIVDEDPTEATGRRNILNAGHTVGHALERLSGYRMAHGEAVAAGLAWEAAAAVAQGHLDAGHLAPVTEAIARLGISPEWKAHGPHRVFEAAGTDKKNRRGRVVYVPLGQIGAPALPPPHTADLTEAALGEGLRLLGGA